MLISRFIVENRIFQLGDPVQMIDLFLMEILIGQ